MVLKIFTIFVFILLFVTKVSAEGKSAPWNQMKKSARKQFSDVSLNRTAAHSFLTKRGSEYNGLRRDCCENSNCGPGRREEYGEENHDFDREWCELSIM